MQMSRYYQVDFVKDIVYASVYLYFNQNDRKIAVENDAA
jgi:hypothetical protein